MVIDEIINKYLNKEPLSNEELSILNEWKVKSSDNDNLLHHLEFLSNEKNLTRRLQKELDDTYYATRKKLENRKSKQRRMMFYRMAAASVLLVIAISSVLFLGRNVGPDNYQGNIQPGSNQAILELADGRKIELSPKVKNVVKEKDALINIDKGMVSYKETKIEEPNLEDSLVYNTIVIPRKGEYKIVLSDGTTIWLNAESKLKYPQKFKGNERRVFLQGEAYFEVTHNKKMPFIVETEAQELTVLGTKFNILAFPEESTVQSTLVSGSVKINVKESDKKVLLIPGQQAIVDKESQMLKVNSVDVTEIIAWKEGFFSLENVTMEEFLNRLSRWYDVKFVYNDDKAKELAFKGSVPRYDNLISVLDMLQAISPVEFKYQKEEIEVTMKN
ncbi:FecR family protein [Plebeiibacterium sediminum]|uniref:FecR domain-containing protein n=1 Tax=Plebeiibacterium sediminum TaxID=2992112 RepID=A0AAE3SF89_9BACT|nr:FecR domain-containing protein [Plebeiobacterium sediminum]MCW3786812.1 FecR domain-containing protein [Plebeiobacterium sediminum]